MYTGIGRIKCFLGGILLVKVQLILMMLALVLLFILNKCKIDKYKNLIKCIIFTLASCMMICNLIEQQFLVVSWLTIFQSVFGVGEIIAHRSNRKL